MARLQALAPPIVVDGAPSPFCKRANKNEITVDPGTSLSSVLLQNIVLADTL